MINTKQVKDKTGDVLIFQSENPASLSRQKSDKDGLLDTLRLYYVWYKNRMGTRDHMEKVGIRLESPNSFLEETQIEKFC